MLEEGSRPDSPPPARAWTLALSLVLTMLLVSVSPECRAADGWGGSVDLTSDYFVRGISRSDDHAALQLDVHYVDSSGLVAGAFVSSAQIEPGAQRDAELSAYLGYVWTTGGDWSGKVLAADYRYPWNTAGSSYDYDEIDVQAAYQDWIRATLSFYPNVRRYTYGGFVQDTAESVELSIDRPIHGRLSAIAGVGYYQTNAAANMAGASGYAYWSAGAAYGWNRVSLELTYVGASGAANQLYYNAAVGGRWAGTLIWRF
jgi:uncharacterized protein (TIGR02001 family)